MSPVHTCPPVPAVPWDQPPAAGHDSASRSSSPGLCTAWPDEFLKLSLPSKVGPRDEIKGQGDALTLLPESATWHLRLFLPGAPSDLSQLLLLQQVPLMSPCLREMPPVPAPVPVCHTRLAEGRSVPLTPVS